MSTAGLVLLTAYAANVSEIMNIFITFVCIFHAPGGIVALVATS